MSDSQLTRGLLPLVFLWMRLKVLKLLTKVRPSIDTLHAASVPLDLEDLLADTEPDEDDTP